MFVILHVIPFLIFSTTNAFQVQCPSPVTVNQRTNCNWIRTNGDSSSFGLLLREITQDHGGTLVTTVRNTNDDSGTFSVTFPSENQFLLEVVRNLDPVPSNEVPQIMASSQTITAVSSSNSGDSQGSGSGSGTQTGTGAETGTGSGSGTESGNGDGSSNSNSGSNDNPTTTTPASASTQGSGNAGSNGDGGASATTSSATTPAQVITNPVNTPTGVRTLSSTSSTANSPSSFSPPNHSSSSQPQLFSDPSVSSTSVDDSETTGSVASSPSGSTISEPSDSSGISPSSPPTSTPTLSSASSDSKSKLPLILGLTFGLLIFLLIMLCALYRYNRTRRRNATNMFFREKMGSKALDFSAVPAQGYGFVSEKSRSEGDAVAIVPADAHSVSEYSSLSAKLDPRVAALWQIAGERVRGMTKALSQRTTKRSTMSSFVPSETGSGVSRVVDASVQSDTLSTTSTLSVRMSNLSAPSSMSEPDVFYTAVPNGQAMTLGRALGIGWDQPAPPKQTTLKERLAPWFIFPPKPPPQAILPTSISSSWHSESQWLGDRPNANAAVVFQPEADTNSVSFPTQGGLVAPAAGVTNGSYTSLVSIPMVAQRLTTDRNSTFGPVGSTWTLPTSFAGTSSSSISNPQVLQGILSYSSHASHGRTDEY